MGSRNFWVVVTMRSPVSRSMYLGRVRVRVRVTVRVRVRVRVRGRGRVLGLGLGLDLEVDVHGGREAGVVP